MGKPKRKVLIISLAIFLLELGFAKAVHLASAKADDLIIDDNGSITLLITNDTVLAVSTSAPSATPTQNESSPKKSQETKTRSPEPKAIPIAPPNSTTTVKVSPSAKGDKKLNITIQTTTPTTPKTTSLPRPAALQKTVDNVILQNAQKEPIITIKASDNQDEKLSIQQKDVKADTGLPLQIDSKTHIVSADTENGAKPILVLPDQAIKNASNKINPSLSVTTSSVTLVSDKGNAEYVVNETRKGKFLGIVNVNIPSQVRISAETGKTISVWQSPLSYLTGFLIR